MMEFLDRAGLSNTLAPRVEVGQEALYEALWSRNSKRALRIIEQGAPNRSLTRRTSNRLLSDPQDQVDLNAPDARGRRPIHVAAMQGMSDTVQALIRAGVPVDAMGTEGNTALHLAAYNGKDGVVTVLIQAGASPTQENAKGDTPMDLAPSEATAMCMCQLHRAAESAMLDNLVRLVAKGVPVNLAGWNGNTPLHASAMGGKPDAARLLLARGADPLRKNRAGETALDIARRLREPGMEEHIIEIVELLEGAEAVAVTERAEVAAAELEAAGAAMDAPGTYREGEDVAYVRDGEEHPAVVVKVHRDDEEPYYTVRVLATGRERQTTANRLVRRAPGGAVVGKPDDKEEADGQDAPAPPSDNIDVVGDGSEGAGIAEKPAISEESLSGGNTMEDRAAGLGLVGAAMTEEAAEVTGMRTRELNQAADKAWGQDGGLEMRRTLGEAEAEAKGDWAASRELFLRVAAALAKEPHGGASSAHGGDNKDLTTGDDVGGAVARDGPGKLGESFGEMLAAAFAALPTQQMGVILRREWVRAKPHSRGDGDAGSTEQMGGNDLGCFPSQAPLDSDADQAPAAVGDSSETSAPVSGTCIEAIAHDVSGKAIPSTAKAGSVQDSQFDEERAAEAITGVCLEVIAKCLQGAQRRAGADASAEEDVPPQMENLSRM